MSVRRTTATSSQIDGTLTVRVPMDLRKRGGRKLVVVPARGLANSDERRRTPAPAESPLTKLLARAFYWKRLFESGAYASLNELAAAEKIDRSYLSKVLRLTMLAPSVVEAILEEQEPGRVTVQRLLANLPVGWQDQEKAHSFQPRLAIAAAG